MSHSRPLALAVLLSTVLVLLPTGGPVSAQLVPFDESGGVDPRAPVNGCGSQGEDGIDVPDDFGTFSFTPACNWHDRCYGTKGMTQAYCDHGMYQRALATCAVSGGDRRACVSLAVLYYLGVTLGGADPFAEGQEAACAREPTGDGRVHGDPHLVTLDGLRYSFQTAGVFTLLRDASTGADVLQAQFFPRSDTFSVVTGYAMPLGDSTVAVQLNPETEKLRVWLDGQAITDPITVLDDGFIQFGSEVIGSRGVVTVRRSDGIRVDGVVNSGRIDLQVQAPLSVASLEGLLGNNDGDPENDLTVAGTQISAADVYEEAFVAAWRVAEADSMFPADLAEVDYHSDAFLEYPIERIDLSSFPAAEVEAARQQCRDAGVAEDGIDECAFDVLASGDESAATAAAVSGTYSRRVSDPATSRLEPDPPLITAAAGGQLDELIALLDAGANPNVGRERDRATPIAFAAQNGHIEVVAELLRRGANPDLQVENGLTGLILASQNGHTEIVEMLLAAGAYPRARSKSGLTPLSQASQNGHAGVVGLLLAAQVPPNSVAGGRPALVAAAANGHVEVVRLLLGAGANIALVDDRGFDALTWAANEGHLATVVELLARGADPDGSGDRAPIVSAAFSGNSELVQALADAGADVDAAESDGFTALMVAAQRGDAAIAQVLLAAGADVAQSTSNGWTALHAAANSDSLEVVQLLLAAGADPAQEDGQGAVPAEFTSDPAILAALGG